MLKVPFNLELTNNSNFSKLLLTYNIPLTKISTIVILWEYKLYHYSYLMKIMSSKEILKKRNKYIFTANNISLMATFMKIDSSNQHRKWHQYPNVLIHSKYRNLK